MAVASRNKRGFTLVEVMVSLLIMSVVMMGILAAQLKALEHNLKNQLRNEGVSVADTEMRRELAKGFANVSTGSASWCRSRRVMTALRNYSVARSGSALSSTKTVSYTVSWRYKTSRFSHAISSALSTTSP